MSELHSVLHTLYHRFPYLSSAACQAIGKDDLKASEPQEEWPGSVQAIQVHRPRLLLEGHPGWGQDQLAPAILHALEGCQVNQQVTALLT